jgi:calnexin
VISSAVKGEAETDAYTGVWELEAALENALKGDKGLVAKSAAHHSAISAKLQEPLDPKGSPLVIQYDVKLQKGLQCGGAYMKLLRYDPDFKSSLFDDQSPYTIMFGPDKCGDTNKVLFSTQLRFILSSITRTL